jgi:manganese/iron transport system ATP-binding protein
VADALLVANSVSVHLGQRRVLDRVDLTVRPGELVGLIGPNGAGKTTLLRTALGLVPLAGGRILIEGTPAGRARGRAGYVPQRHEFAWDFPISVADAVMSGRAGRIGWLRRPAPSDRAAVELALDRVGLTELRRRPIGELSGGQRQRVLLARALAGQPRLLLLDEPFTAVDRPTQEALGGLLSRLVARGHAVLMATHDLTGAAAVCTRVCLLHGRVLADGAPEVLTDPGVLLGAFGMATR